MLAAVAATTILASVALAGGRARVSVVQAPKQVRAGEMFDFVVTVMPEVGGHRRNLEPVVTAVLGDRQVVTSALAEKGAHRYRASLRLPEAGEWTIRVDSRYCETRMTPWAIEARAAEKAGKPSS